MKKADFIELIQKEGGYKSKTEAEKALKAVISSIEHVFINNDTLTLAGFATFSTAIQKGKTGKVPGTDKTYTTEDKKVPKIKFGKIIKDRVASGN